MFSKVDRFIAISQQTKDELIKFYNIDFNKIDVIYHGIKINNLNKTQEKINKRSPIFYMLAGEIVIKILNFLLKHFVNFLKVKN